MTDLSLAERVVALDRALAAVPHAFGGALSLAYHAEPRGTVDIDINLFVPDVRFREVAAPLAKLGVAVGDPAVEELVHRDGQVRVWWDDTPVDLFFAYDPFHHAAAAAIQVVPFAATSIPILSADHLIVGKAVFNRGKDWIDIDAIVAAETPIDVAEVLRWVGRIAGDDDPRYERIAAVLTRR